MTIKTIDRKRNQLLIFYILEKNNQKFNEMSLKINDYLINEEMIEKALTIGEVSVGCVHFKDDNNCGQVVVSRHNRTNESTNGTTRQQI
jgi:hypothetical protein